MGARKGHTVSAETRAKISAAMKGKKRPEEEKRKIAESMKGKQNALGYRHTEEAKKKIVAVQTGRKHSPETIAKLKAAAKKRGGRKKGFRLTEAARRKASESAKARVARGEHNWFVDGKGRDRTTERKAEMDRLEYRLWREAVFARDDWTCQCCGGRGGVLIADHYRPWKTHPELRYEVANGRTLCGDCHKMMPTYGWRIRKYPEMAQMAEALLGELDIDS